MIWCGAVLLALCFSGSFSHVIVIEETANGTVLHRHLNSHDLCAALGGLQSGSDGNKIVSKTKAENYQIPADKVSHDTRSIVGPSCRGRTRELLRMTLREVTRWAAVATLATFFRREGRFDVYNSRAFSACFPFVGPALRWRVRARFDAVSVEASMADTGVVTLRCDDPGHCCSADPSRLALVLEEADEIILCRPFFQRRLVSNNILFQSRAELLLGFLTLFGSVFEPPASDAMGTPPSDLSTAHETFAKIMYLKYFRRRLLPEFIE